MLVFKQGVMTGKDFARSVVCSVHTNQIEDYLAKVDALPEELAKAQVASAFPSTQIMPGCCCLANDRGANTYVIWIFAFARTVAPPHLPDRGVLGTG